MNRLLEHMCRTALVLVAVLALAPPAAAELDAKRTVLDNGLRVLHVKQHNLPLVVVQLRVKAGSAHEPAELAGLASLSASLLNEGTSTRTSIELSEAVEFIGAKLGASASDDYTTITLKVLKKDVETGFALFADVLLNPVFPEAEITRKRELIKGGLRQRQEDPGYVAKKAFIKQVFGAHPYGRITAGSPVTLDRITRDDIRRFYETYYVPNNAILSVVGDLSEAELSALIDKYLGGWAGRPVPKLSLPEVPAPQKSVILIDKDLTQANIIIGHAGLSRMHPDYYAMGVMNYILGGGGFSSRLMERIRDEMGLAYSVYSQNVPMREAGMFRTVVQTKNESARKVIDEILKQIRRIQSEEVSDQELSDAKTFMIGSFPRRLDTMSKIAGFLVSVEFYGLGLDYPEQYRKIIGAITKEDIMRVARAYLDPERTVLVVVARQSEAGLQ